MLRLIALIVVMFSVNVYSQTIPPATYLGCIDQLDLDYFQSFCVDSVGGLFTTSGSCPNSNPNHSSLKMYCQPVFNCPSGYSRHWDSVNNQGECLPDISSAASSQNSSAASSCANGQVWSPDAGAMVCYTPCMDSTSGCSSSSSQKSCPTGTHSMSINGQTFCSPDLNNSSAANSSAAASQSNSAAGSSSGGGSGSSSGNSGSGSGSGTDAAANSCPKILNSNVCQAVPQSYSCPNSYTDSGGQKWCVSTGQNPSSQGDQSSSKSRNALASDCVAQPACDGDQIDCAILIQSWKNSCIQDGDSQIQNFAHDFSEAADKANSDYAKAYTDDVSKFLSDGGVGFGDSPSALRSAILSYIPQVSSCQPYEITFTDRLKLNLSCTWFEVIKSISAWFFSVLAAMHIWSIATRSTSEE